MAQKVYILAQHGAYGFGPWLLGIVTEKRFKKISRRIRNRLIVREATLNKIDLRKLPRRYKVKN